MTPAEFAAIRSELGLSQLALSRVLGVARMTVLRWENGLVPIPRTVDLAIDNIRRHRAAMVGNAYPLMGDVLRVMREEGLSQDDAVRAFGVEP